MGTITKFNLQMYIDKYNSKNFIETGTYTGIAVDYAIQFKFDTILSIELIKDFADKCKEKFKNNTNVTIINDTSVNGLSVLPSGNSIFWLDAHLPNFYRPEYNGNYLSDISTPLQKELELIKSIRDISQDVFIIDDLRIYERGPFEQGEWLDAINMGIGNADFIFDILSETHNVEKRYDDEGYIVCTPKAF